MKELLSPVGNIECLYAAINNGADAVYLGGKVFSARHFASNFTDEELKEAVLYAHLYGVKVYVAVNIIIYQDEIASFIKYIDYLYNIGVDALTMQDIGMIFLVREKYPSFEITASTQMHSGNNDSLLLLKKIGIKKAVLDRELSLNEIETFSANIEKEVFIHGALCNSYSGCCLFSSLNGGRSGNRGKCVQSCRLPYRLIKNNSYLETPNKYLLSTKELNTTMKFEELLKSNITSFKIEGRMKSPAYVGYVTHLYRQIIDNYNNHKNISLTTEEKDNLKILFNRDFTTGYLFNDDKIMNPSSSNHQGLEIGRVIDVTSKKIKIKLTKDLYQEDGIRFKESSLGIVVNKLYNHKNLLTNYSPKGSIITIDNKINLKTYDTVLKTSSPHLEKEILSLPNKKIPIDINIFLEKDNLNITFEDLNHNHVSESIKIESPLTRPTTVDEIKEKISKLGNTPFKINNFHININDNIFINMRSINEARRKLVSLLIEKRTKIPRLPIKKSNIPTIKYQSSFRENEISVFARTKKQVEASLKSNVTRIYVDSSLFAEYQHYPNIYLRLPRVTSKYNYQSSNILITELGALNHYEGKKLNIISDYYLNVVNNYSIKFFEDHNIERITLSPEYDYQKLALLNKDKLELIIYGRLELMLTKSCPIKEVLNKCPCRDDDKYYLEDHNKNRYPIVHDNCLTHIMHYKNIDYMDKVSYYQNIGIKSFRLELFDESYEDTLKLINRLNNSLN